MARQDYTRFQVLMQQIASTRAGAWFLARTLHHFDRLFLKLTGGRITVTGDLVGLPMVDVIMVGAKSGLKRIVPLVYIQDDAASNTFALIASNFGRYHNPAWYYNLKANPHVQCSIRGITEEYITHEACGEEYEQFWQGAVDTYFGFELYKRRAAHRYIPIMVLTPANE